MSKCHIAVAVFLLLSNIPSSQAAQVLFTPALILSEEYSDNLFLDNQDEVDDFKTATGLDLKGQLLWHTAGIELNYRPTYNSYHENNQLSYWRHEAQLYSWKEFQRNTKFELRDTYLRTSDPRDQSATILQNGQPQGPVIAADSNRRGRREYYTNLAEARINHDFGSNDRVYLAYQYSILRDVDASPDGIVEDNDISTPSIGLVLALSQRWGMELDSAYAVEDYKDRNDRNQYDGNLRSLYRFGRNISGLLGYRHTIVNYDQNTDEDYNVYLPFVGIRVDFQDNGRIEIGGGYYTQDFETSKNREGSIITSTFYKRWALQTGYFDISGGSGYTIDDKGAQDNGLNIYYEGRIEIGHDFTHNFTGSIYGGYRYDNYPDETPERTDKTTSTGLALEWQALRWMHLRLAYDFNDVRSDFATDQYAENRALFTIRMEPSRPYRLSD